MASATVAARAAKATKTFRLVPAMKRIVARIPVRMMAVPRSRPSRTRTTRTRPNGSTGTRAWCTCRISRPLRSSTAAAHRAMASFAASEGCMVNPPMRSQLVLPPTECPRDVNATRLSRRNARPNAGQARPLSTRRGRRRSTRSAARPPTAHIAWRRKSPYEPSVLPMASTEEDERTITRPSTVRTAVHTPIRRAATSRARGPSSTRQRAPIRPPRGDGSAARGLRSARVAVAGMAAPLG